jgi:Ca-activated chloride channel homolog
MSARLVVFRRLVVALLAIWYVGPDFSPGVRVGPDFSPGIQAYTPELKFGPTYTPELKFGPTYMPELKFGPTYRQDPVAPPLAIRITSPLGRTGTSGAIRIVAQVTSQKDVALSAVRFYVDNTLVGEDPSGPPFAVEWTDENPFEPREIRADVTDSDGNVARDVITLKPLELVERTEISSVYVETSVQDKVGHFVTGLDASAFSLAEDDVPQRLDVVKAEQLPATYTLLVDSSQSMARRIDFVRDAASQLASFLREKDRMIVAPFSRTLSAITGPTDDRATVADAIAKIESRGGTAILDALEEAAQVISGIEGRHAIILITDGYDEHSTQAFDDALAAVQRSGAAVYVVGIGGVAGISLKGERFLRKLAADTGGRAFFPTREIELGPIHSLVANEVTLRYVLTYVPQNQKVDGTWRRIAVAVNDPALRVRARPGYFAPKPPPVRPSIEFTLKNLAREMVDVTIDDLEVVEDGVPQKLEAFQEAVTPVSIVFALDASGSMKAATDALKAAARSFVENVRPEDALALILFANRSQFAHDLTTRRDWSVEAIDKYVAGGGTALYDAAYDALSRLRGIEGRRVVVLMTDGRDENNPGTAPGSTHTYPQVLERLKGVDATVYTVGMGARIDRKVLEELAAVSGGEAYFPEDVASLPRDFNRILETLRRRFVISYTSTNSTRDGGWRKVEIRSRKQGVAILSRGGYNAPDR